MHTVTLKLITIVAEAVLKEPLIRALRDAGATGYTLTEVRGEGSRGRRTGELPGDNVRLEALVGPTSVEVVLRMLEERYFPNYAVVAWVADVGVVRGEKYA